MGPCAPLRETALNCQTSTNNINELDLDTYTQPKMSKGARVFDISLAKHGRALHRVDSSAGYENIAPIKEVTKRQTICAELLVNVTTNTEKCEHSVVVSHDIHWQLRCNNFLTTIEVISAG